MALEKKVCLICGNESLDFFAYKDGVICENCYYENYNVCDICDTIKHPKEMIYIDGYGCVCDDCRIELDIEVDYRICTECGRKMMSGYCVGDGLEYYCSDDCLHKNYTDEEWTDIYNSDWGYWTEWY